MENTTLVDHYSQDGATERVPMVGEPPLWADCRPALREVLWEYHAKDQNNVWTAAGVLYAILLGGDGGQGAFDDGQITITRLGSSQRYDSATGTWKQFKDHSFADATVRACVNALEQKTVFLLLGGTDVTYSPVIPLDKYRFFARYLAIFSSIWVEENEDAFAVIKAKMERLDISKSSVCEHPTNGPPVVPMDQQANLTKALRQNCRICGQESLQVYRKEWVCLNRLPRKGQAACPEAATAQKRLTAAEKCQYHPHFQAERLNRSGIKVVDFAPPRPAETLSKLSAKEKSAISLEKLLRGPVALNVTNVCDV